jgi:hypothetical protein
VAASRAHIVRQLEFAAVRAFLKLDRRQRVMAAAHIPLRRRGFSLRDSHCGTFECNFDNNKNCDDLRLITAGCPAGGGWIVANRGSYSGWSCGSKRLPTSSCVLIRASRVLKLDEASHRCAGGCNQGEMQAQNMMSAPRYSRAKLVELSLVKGLPVLGSMKSKSGSCTDVATCFNFPR